MEPYKFEHDIKNKLEKRRIQPSNNSWQKLSTSLEKNEHKKNNKFLWIMGVAASIVGILFVVSIFFKDDSVKSTPIIVTSPEFNKVDTLIKIAVEEVINKNKVTSPKNNSLEAISNKKTHKSSKPNKEVSVPIDAVAFNSKMNAKEIAVVKEIKDVTTTTIEDEKINNIISQIEALKTQSLAVTNNDIDALLFEAQQELALQKIIDESKKTVDAYKLLQDVEADLDKSTREKFLETLKLNYENMKTLIAQRND